MSAQTHYRVDIGEDCYIGTAEEVVGFMMTAEGAPPGDSEAYMAGVAKRVAETLQRGPISTAGAEAFLESLSEHQIARVSVSAAPSTVRVDPKEALGDGPIAFGPDVDPNDVDY